MIRCIVLTLLLVAATAAAQDDDTPPRRSREAERARQRYERDAEQVERTLLTRLLKARIRARERYVDELKRALEIVKRRNELDEAIRIQKDIEAMTEEIAELTRQLEGKDEQIEKMEQALGYKLKRHPEGARLFEGSYYKVVEKEMSWTKAFEMCKEMGGYLVTISDRDEHEFVWKLCGKRPCWLGGSDKDEEGKWRWVTGETSHYTAWLRGEPNNNEQEEHYLMMGLTVEGKPSPTWNDARDAGASMMPGHIFVCEWPR